MIILLLFLGFFQAINHNQWKNSNQNHKAPEKTQVSKDWLKVNNRWYHKNHLGYIQAGCQNLNHERYFQNEDITLIAENINKKNFFNRSFDLLDFNQEFLKLLNQERVKQDVHPLSYHFNLQKGVNLRANEMRALANISHSRPNGKDFSTAFNYLYLHTHLTYLGENIASRPVTTELVQELNNNTDPIEKILAEKFFQQYYNSPAHYENMIESNFTGFSVGLIIEDAQLYNLMIFSG